MVAYCTQVVCKTKRITSDLSKGQITKIEENSYQDEKMKIVKETFSKIMLNLF